MLTSECFPRANDDLEERVERDKIWPQWEKAYKRATRLSLLVMRVVLFNTSCFITDFSLTVATERLSK